MPENSVRRPRALPVSRRRRANGAVHRGDYRGYLRALVHADRTIGALADVLRRRSALGHPSTLFVTTDHGREAAFVSHGREHPESARVFLVAAGAAVQPRGFVAADKVRHLADVGQTVRAALGLSAPSEPGAGEVLTELIGLEAAESRQL